MSFKENAWKIPVFGGNFVGVVLGYTPLVREIGWAILVIGWFAYAILRDDEEGKKEGHLERVAPIRAIFLVTMICVLPGFILGSLLSLGGGGVSDRCYGGGRYC